MKTESDITSLSAVPTQQLRRRVEDLETALFAAESALRNCGEVMAANHAIQALSQSKAHEVGGISVGDVVRSFDFSTDRDLQGAKSFYIVGRVTNIVVLPNEDHHRYEIKVFLLVREGSVRCPEDEHRYPPVNGLATAFGRTTNFVEKL